MAILDSRSSPLSIRKFSARVTILKHPTTITEGYQAVFHMKSIRSTVRFSKITKKILRTGDTSNVILEFLFHPWYIKENDIFVLRDTRTRAIGKIVRVLS